MKYDEVLDVINGWGIYQKGVFLWSLPTMVMSGFILLNPVFLLGTPEHRCKIPGYDNDTYEVQGPQHEALINESVPLTADGDYEKCVLYGHWKYSAGSNMSDVTIECDSWVYDRTVFTETFVSKRDIVCGRSIQVDNAEMILYSGALAGSLVCGPLGDRYGRKIVMYVFGVLLAGAQLALAWAQNYAMFVGLTFAVGFTLYGQTLPLYIIALEITGVENRVWPAVVANQAWVLGLEILALIGYILRDWYTIQLATAIPALIFILYWWCIPESPRWLLSQRRFKEAEVIIRRMAKWNKTAHKLPDSFFDERSIELGIKKGHFFSLCSSKQLTKRTVLVAFNWATVSFAYYGIGLNTKNLAGDLYLNFALSALVEIPSYIAVQFTMDRFGRRTVFSTSMLLCGIACLSTIFSVKYGGDDLSGLTMALSTIGRFGVSAAFAVSFVHMAELFPTAIRNNAYGMAQFSAKAGTLVSPYVVDLGPFIGGDMEAALPMIVFGGFTTASGLLTLLLPETLNTPMYETLEELHSAMKGDNHDARHNEQILEENSDTTKDIWGARSADISSDLSHKFLLRSFKKLAPG